MDKLYSPAKMAQLRAKHDFRHSKSLGQNFLSDKNIIDAIIEGSEIGAEDLVIEIGPGMGRTDRGGGGMRIPRCSGGD